MIRALKFIVSVSSSLMCFKLTKNCFSRVPFTSTRLDLDLGPHHLENIQESSGVNSAKVCNKEVPNIRKIYLFSVEGSLETWRWCWEISRPENLETTQKYEWKKKKKHFAFCIINPQNNFVFVCDGERGSMISSFSCVCFFPRSLLSIFQQM